MFDYIYVVCGIVNGEIFDNIARFDNPIEAINCAISLIEHNIHQYDGYDNYVIEIKKKNNKGVA